MRNVADCNEEVDERVGCGGKREEEVKAIREGEAKERACFSARDVLRLPQTRLNSLDANTPIPVTREALLDGIIR